MNKSRMDPHDVVTSSNDDDEQHDDEHAYRSYKTTTVHVVKTNVCVSTKFGKLSTNYKRQQICATRAL